MQPIDDIQVYGEPANRITVRYGHGQCFRLKRRDVAAMSLMCGSLKGDKARSLMTSYLIDVYAMESWSAQAIAYSFQVNHWSPSL